MNVPVSEANRKFNTIPFDRELTPGARNAVQVCLRVQPGEKVTVITEPLGPGPPSPYRTMVPTFEFLKIET